MRAHKRHHILFKQCHDKGYKARTEENVFNSDITLAFARDFTTTGELCTAKAAAEFKRPLVKVQLPVPFMMGQRADFIAKQLSALNRPAVRINIAGNGLYTLVDGNENFHGFLQESLDYQIYLLLLLVSCSDDLNCEIVSIVTGGQTGIDEAGAKAGRDLGIRTTVNAPKGWVFRTGSGVDVSNEKLFKARFDHNGLSEH